MSATFKVIGTRPLRHDGVDKVTGRALYGADVQMSGLIHGRILRSPHAHAKITRIDTSKAEALPGVFAVATSADFPDPGDKVAELGEGAIVLSHLSANCLARGKVLYRGHAVAAVAAETPAIAEQALSLIDVTYEPLPHVTDVQKAMADGAPILHDDLRTESLGKTSDKPSNVAKHIRFKIGDSDAAFASAKVVVEREFHTATVHQGYIEPHNGTALYTADGNVTVWCSTQGTFTVRAQVSELLGIPLTKIKVVPMEIGGGFGGKIRVYLEPVAVVLSRKSGRPVKVTMSREEVFEGTGPTPGSFIRVKMGADEKGKIVAAEAYLAYEAGAYPGSPVGPGCMCVFACYDIPNVTIDGYDVVVNKPATSAYRAPGATNAAFASETVLNEIADALKMDQLDIRLLNAAKEGTRRADGPTYPRVGMVETLQAAKAHAHYAAPLASPPHYTPTNGTTMLKGRGVASGFWFNIGLKSAATATVNADGTVALIEGSTDIGGSRTGIAMQLAEALGITAEEVKPMVVDTDLVGYTDVTGGSRVTFATGWAAYEAAQDIIRQMVTRAAAIWKVPEAEVTYADGGVVCGSKGERMSFKQLAAKLHETGGTIIGRGSVDPKGVGGGFGTHVVDVEVDPDTGKVSIARYTAVQDVGRAIHPSYVEGQIQGGAVQGIGWGLNEEYVYNDHGHMANASYLDYRMPTSLDLPMIDAVIVEVPNPGHPYGVRGVGEVPIVPPPAAIANAIAAATGVRMLELPMSPPRVLKALMDAKKA